MRIRICLFAIVAIGIAGFLSQCQPISTPLSPPIVLTTPATQPAVAPPPASTQPTQPAPAVIVSPAPAVTAPPPAAVPVPPAPASVVTTTSVLGTLTGILGVALAGVTLYAKVKSDLANASQTKAQNYAKAIADAAPGLTAIVRQISDDKQLPTDIATAAQLATLAPGVIALLHSVPAISATLGKSAAVATSAVVTTKLSDAPVVP